MSPLFQQNAREYLASHAPLAERLRPADFSEMVGQERVLAPGSPLCSLLAAGRLTSLILWGPPGTGKTTLARILARQTERQFVQRSAVSCGVAEIKRILKEAGEALKLYRKETVLFLDEIHRFNKAQQDSLLHGVESGRLILIGATTENPSFEINSALLSRMQVVVLSPLQEPALQGLLERALKDVDRGLGADQFRLQGEAGKALVCLAAGDARALLNLLDLVGVLARGRGERILTLEMVEKASGQRAIMYDRAGQEHYGVVSAFIKSMRGSDPDAALYYLARMLDGGEDPGFVARRLIIFSSEDIGNADPGALRLAIACKDAVAHIGMPEGLYPLSQCTLYLACAPKSAASGEAYRSALQAVRQHGALPVPLSLRNAATPLAKSLGHGAGYISPHVDAAAAQAMEFMPEAIRGLNFYHPTRAGFEKRLKQWMEEHREARSAGGRPHRG